MLARVLVGAHLEPTPILKMASKRLILSSKTASGRSIPLVCVLIFVWLLSSTVFPRTALACDCFTSLSACNEVGLSNLVFIGTVESITPIFLNRWHLLSSSSLSSVNEAYADARESPSAAALDRLKDTYLKVFPGLTANEKRQLLGAKTTQDVASLFNSTLGRGMRVNFSVKTFYKLEDDDDAPKDAGSKDQKAKNETGGKDDDARKEDERKHDSGKTAKSGDREKEDKDSFDVWTPFGDCGYDFQIGETYLVYANNDEGADSFFTGSCTRTRRLSDAGADLAYLFFYKNNRTESARLDGFATTDGSQFDFDQLHDPEIIKSPVAGVIVELQSDRLLRYAVSDRNGKFVFDGLREGDYQISAFASGYPLNTKLLTGPQSFHIGRRKCAYQVLVLPKSNGS